MSRSYRWPGRDASLALAAAAQDYPTRTITDHRAVRRRRPDRHGGARRRRSRCASRWARRSSSRTPAAPAASSASRRWRTPKPDGYTILIHAHRHGDQPDALPQPALRPAEGLRAHRPHHRRADDDHRAGRIPAEGHEGAPRLHQGEQGQGDLRQRRHRRGLAPVRHALHERDPASTSPPCRTRARARR